MLTHTARKPLLCIALIAALNGCAARPAAPVATSQPAAVDPVIARIREEGLTRSQVMAHADYLCNVIGQRLTGSPSLEQAHQWTRDRLTAFGLSNAHLEEWGPFGSGWTVERYVLQVTEPRPMLIASFPKAWSPGTDGPTSAEVVYVKAKTLDDLKAYEGKLKGKIVFFGDVKKLEAPFEAPAKRLDDKRLDEIAKQTPKPAAIAPASQPAGDLMRSGPTTTPTTNTSASTLAERRMSANVIALAHAEGALCVVEPSLTLDGSGYWVAGATVPRRQSTTAPAEEDALAAPTTQPKVWQLKPTDLPPQVSMSSDHYARILRLLETAGRVTMSLDLKVGYHEKGVTGFNTIAEIPGSDLADEVVMVGAHLDSWHAATGATDNAAGVSAAMEAVRILKALNLKPRRTIRVALWGGEEIGLLGSTAYVKQHFGYQEDAPTTRPTSKPKKRTVKLPGHEKLAVYFNLDNGTGRIRGVSAQGNAAAAKLFEQWLVPFHDLDAKTVSLRTAGSTDHIAFDRVGLPGFQFIQDPIDYMNRTHHTTLDTYERLQAEDLKQASTIMAAFAWNAANTDARFPRKPAD